MGKSAVAVPPLNVMENRELRKHEEVIQRGLHSFVEVGRALREIRDSKLYREEHKSFEAYCAAKWNIQRTRAYDLINNATVSEEVSENSDTPAPKEAHAEALAKCPPETRKETWQEAVATAPNGKVTAKHVADVINRRNIPTNTAAAFHHQLAEDEDDDGFEPDAIGSGEVIDSHAVPDEEPAPPVTSYFKRFREVWDEADDTARCVIRDFVNRKPGEDE